MKCIRTIRHFVKNGGDVFGTASRGEYVQKSADIINIEKELFSRQSSIREDRRNAFYDRKNIEQDICSSFNKLVTQNG